MKWIVPLQLVYGAALLVAVGSHNARTQPQTKDLGQQLDSAVATVTSIQANLVQKIRADAGEIERLRAQLADAQGKCAPPSPPPAGAPGPAP